jgi:transcriptional regulator GlxA family with amidase domain
MPVQRTTRYQEIVDRVIELTRRCVGKPISIEDMSHLAGVSPRTLARAFRAVHGVPASHFLRVLRLAQARDELLSAVRGEETVTEVAMRFGFRELGKFAALYRKEFGESPSATLQRSAAHLRDQQGAPVEPHHKKFAACS